MLLDMALTELLLAKDYTPMTVRRRREALGEFIDWANAQGVTDIEQVTRPLVRRYIADLRDRPNVRYGGKLSGETQHGRASVVRMYLRFCAREGWLDERVVAFFEMPKTAKKVVQALSQEQYRLLVSATDGCALPGLPLRDKAILALLFDTGMRAHELCALRRDAVTIAPGESFVRVEGKGRKERELGLGKHATLALQRYLSRARPNSDSPLVFLARDARPMTPNGIDRMLYRLRETAGPGRFQGVRVSAHTFRHSFAIHYMRQEAGDIYKLSRLLGHENVHTTERYLRAFQAEDARKNSRSVLDGL